MKKVETEDLFKCLEKAHKIWWQFSKWMAKNHGKNGEMSLEDMRNLCGWDVMQSVENYVKRYCKEIKIVHCDDEIYANSIIVLVPHPDHGITMIFIPQLTDIQNQFFLYSNHYLQLLQALKELRDVCYSGDFYFNKLKEGATCHFEDKCILYMDGICNPKTCGDFVIL